MSKAVGPAQCWCGAIYANSDDLVDHWRDLVKRGESLFDHEKPRVER